MQYFFFIIIERQIPLRTIKVIEPTTFINAAPIQVAATNDSRPTTYQKFSLKLEWCTVIQYRLRLGKMHVLGAKFYDRNHSS